jgi:predicted phosphodiesterase
MSKKEILIFSDTHLFDNTAADNCGIKLADSLVKLLKNKQYELKIALGDFIEGLQGKTFGSIKKVYGKTFIDLTDLISFYIEGNHDAKFLPLLKKNVYKEYTFLNSIKLLHGHQFTVMNNGKVISLFLRWWAFIERLLGKKIAEHVDEYILCEKESYYQKFLSKVGEYCFKSHIRICIIGHSHRLGIYCMTRDGIIFSLNSGEICDPLRFCVINDYVLIVNTGSCTNGNIEYATIIYDDNDNYIDKIKVQNSNKLK